MRLTLHGARLVDAETEIASGDITIDGPHIHAIGSTPGPTDGLIDVSETIITPGFIDVHTHGGGGFNLHTTSVEEIQSYARWVVGTGVTSFLIAVVGVPDALPEEQLRTAVAAIEQRRAGAEPLGIHLEGPYINEKRRGAHPASWLRVPSTTETEHILDLTRGYLRLITLAPELPGAHEMIRRLVESGVTVSIGHTDANYEQACQAIQLGATHLTHCFNAMRPINHHNPGVIEAVVESPQVRGELIADGVHVHPAVMSIGVTLLGPERMVLITDAQAGAGIPDAIFEFAGQQAHTRNGAAYLIKDGTLAGSVLTMEAALHNIQRIASASFQEAVRMLSWNPAQAAHVQDRKGRLLAGYDADLLIFDQTQHLQATICRGRLAYVNEPYRERLSIMQTNS